MSDAAPANRLVSLDVFRGITIAAMTLVNNPGTWSAIYAPLRHAEWNGITPTDYIFPFFLFIVGVAIPIALGQRVKAGNTTGLYRKIVARSATIFIVSILMSAIPFFRFSQTDVPQPLKLVVLFGWTAALFLYLWGRRRAGIATAIGMIALTLGFSLLDYTVIPYDVANMRIPGVLQRIAVCYLIASVIFLNTNRRQQFSIAVIILLGYWLLMTLIPVPGCEVTTIDDKACNLAAFIDRLILGESHIWSQGKVYDPEGILSTLPAIVTTLSGVLAGSWLMSARRDNDHADADDSAAALPSPRHPERTRYEIAAGLFFAGAATFAAGRIWSLAFPLNKALWTSSYVLYTSGLAMLMLASCYWLIDLKGYKRWTKPFVIFGVNALALYVFSGIMARAFGMISVGAQPDGETISLGEWLFENLFAPYASPINASLAFAVSFVLIWLFLMWLLYRRRIYIKV